MPSTRTTTSEKTQPKVSCPIADQSSRNISSQRYQNKIFIYTQLNDKLFAMYAIKNESEDHLFIERSSLIKKMRPQESMKYLGIS